jgi:hypothetical protein
VELAGVKAVGVARLGEELSGLGRVVRVRVDRERELEARRDVVARRLGGAQRLRLAQRSHGQLLFELAILGRTEPRTCPAAVWRAAVIPRRHAAGDEGTTAAVPSEGPGPLASRVVARVFGFAGESSSWAALLRRVLALALFTAPAAAAGDGL